MGIGGECIRFLEGNHVSVGLQVVGVDARGRGVEIALDPVDSRCVEGVQVDQGVVVQNLRVVGADEAHAAHVSSEGEHRVDATRRLQRGIPSPEIEQFEFVGVDGRVLGNLEVDTAHPMPASLEFSDEVMADESSGAGHQNPAHTSPFVRNSLRRP